MGKGQGIWLGTGGGGGCGQKNYQKSKILVLNIKQTKTPYIRPNSLFDKYNMHWLSSKSQHWILSAPESKPRLPGVRGQIKNPVSLGWLSVALATLHWCLKSHIL